MRHFGVLGLSLLLVISSAAGGDHTWAEEAARPRRVEIVMAGATSDVMAAENTLRDLLGSLQIDSSFTRTSTIDLGEAISKGPEDTTVLARVWVDLRSSERILVFLVDQRLERAIVRQVRLPHRIDPVAIEEVGQIVSTAIETLLVGRPLSLTLERAASLFRAAAEEPDARPSEQGKPTYAPDEILPEPSPPPADEPPPESSSSTKLTGNVWLGLQYSLALWSFDQPALHGPEARLLMGVDDITLRPALCLSAIYRVPVTIESQDVNVNVRQLQFHLDIQLQVFDSRRLELGVVLGGGVDLNRVEAGLSEQRDGLAIEPDQLVVVPIVHAAVVLYVNITESLILSAGLGVDFNIKDIRYVIQRPAAIETIFEPWRALPVFSLGIVGDLL